ncbi:hypothetical protein GCM10010381_62960 [Streptomyces xantholiticus]|nr:hypothetical protein GCM10010381_62960 [Streptomyces xantholiticus]
MAFHAPSCAAVGALNAPENQPRVAGEKESSAVLAMPTIVHPTTDIESGTRVPAVAAPTPTDALPGCPHVVLPAGGA